MMEWIYDLSMNIKVVEYIVCYDYVKEVELTLG